MLSIWTCCYHCRNQTVYVRPPTEVSTRRPGPTTSRVASLALWTLTSARGIGLSSRTPVGLIGDATRHHHTWPGDPNAMIDACPGEAVGQFGREQSPVPCRAVWRSSWEPLTYGGRDGTRHREGPIEGGDTRWDGPPQTATHRVTLANRGADDHTECRGRPTDSSRPTEIRAPRHGFGPPAALRERRRRDRPPTCLSRVPHRPAWIVQGC